jgi:hypothetical protein
VHANESNTEELKVLEEINVVDEMSKYIEYKNNLIKNITI